LQKDTLSFNNISGAFPGPRLRCPPLSWQRCCAGTEFALKATPAQAPLAHRLLMETRQLVQQFNVVVFDQACADELLQLQRSSKTRKRYADAMIAAMARAGQHIVVTRNQAHFDDLLAPGQLVNWIDAPPGQ
jgi:hypothetical protein